MRSLLALLLVLLLASISSVNADGLRAALASKLALQQQEQPLDIADTNLANYGSQMHVDAREAAAQAEREFAGAGQHVGIEVWRVENTRHAQSDAPQFGVKRWQQPGSFYSGDSYLVLHTYQAAAEGSKLLYDVFFWLGSTSSQDEIGVAAYKAVELDDFLKGQAVQHREVQGFESPLFLALFPAGVLYLEGGIDSGFRSAAGVVTDLDLHEPRLFQVRKLGSTVQVFEVPARVSSLNQGDAFVLDAGTVVYVFEGSSASPFEKSKASIVAHNLADGRAGKSRSTHEVDAAFWSALGGGGQLSDVASADSVTDASVTTGDAAFVPQLYRLSDASGAIGGATATSPVTLALSKVAEGSTISAALLDGNDVFFLDVGVQLVVWVGNNASWQEKTQAMTFVTRYLKSTGRPLTLPVTVIRQGQPNSLFAEVVKA